MPTRNLVRGSLLSTIGAIVVTMVGALSLRARRMMEVKSASEKAKGTEEREKP